MHAKLTTLHTLRLDRLIQEQVKDHLRQLSISNKNGMDLRIKSQLGVSVDVYVKEKIKWHHEHVKQYICAKMFKGRLTHAGFKIKTTSFREHIPVYKLSMLALVTKTEIKILVQNSPSNQCTSDPIPTGC